MTDLSAVKQMLWRFAFCPCICLNIDISKRPIFWLESIYFCRLQKSSCHFWRTFTNYKLLIADFYWKTVTKSGIIRSHNWLWILPSSTGSEARLRGMNLSSWLNFRVFIFLLGHIPKQNKSTVPVTKGNSLFQNFRRGIYAVFHFHTLQRISQ